MQSNSAALVEISSHLNIVFQCFRPFAVDKKQFILKGFTITKWKISIHFANDFKRTHYKPQFRFI